MRCTGTPVIDNLAVGVEVLFPTFFRIVEFGLQRLLSVAIGCRALKVLGVYRLAFFLSGFFNLAFELLDFIRDSDVGDVYT